MIGGLFSVTNLKMRVVVVSYLSTTLLNGFLCFLVCGMPRSEIQNVGGGGLHTFAHPRGLVLCVAWSVHCPVW